mmetsp:Transcript_92028/g.269250  ORF Transcript_92028/g.269250 Transcript_92028/m.269250 type:complete len:107 (+) Transcript_92028:16-336(+)
MAMPQTAHAFKAKRPTKSSRGGNMGRSVQIQNPRPGIKYISGKAQPAGCIHQHLPGGNRSMICLIEASKDSIREFMDASMESMRVPRLWMACSGSRGAWFASASLG